MTPPLTEDPTLTDAELDELLRDNHGEGDAYAVRYEVRALVKELRHHRSRLSAEDVEALRWARECIVRGLKRDSCYDADGNPPPGFTMISRALAVLERLCGGKEGV